MDTKDKKIQLSQWHINAKGKIVKRINNYRRHRHGYCILKGAKNYQLNWKYVYDK